MRSQKWAFVIVCFFPAASMRAEFFIDLSAGAAYTVPSKIKQEGEPIVDLPSSTSAEGALRIGGYIVKWFGLALDFSYFETDSGIVTTNNVFTLTPLVLFRVPLMQTDEIQNGSLQPYVGIGPGIFMLHTVVEEGDFEADDERWFSLGLDFRAGLAWQFHQNLAIFGEYKITYFIEDLEGFLSFSPERERDILTHHFLVGISFRFG